MKTIAVITTADTKHAELELARDFINNNGFNALTIDTSTRTKSPFSADIKPVDIIKALGYTWEEFLAQETRDKKLHMMQKGLAAIIAKLVQDDRIQGVLGLGGFQNTTLNATAMQKLPVGFPKVILSTIASGSRTFGPFVGIKDITMMPSIADIAGVNPVTEVVIKNAAAAVMGMAQFAGDRLRTDGLVIGATMMGATNDGIRETIDRVQGAGYSVITFHSTGVGGQAMEDLINAGAITAVLDLCIHEIVAEDIFAAGFCMGAKDRLSAAVRQGIPMVLSPAGLDFVVFSYKELQDGIVGDPARRKFTFHNKDIVHIKLFPEEAARAAEIVVDRLKPVRGNAVMVMPLRGIRSESKPGGRMHDPAVDHAIFDVFRRKLNRNVRLIELDAHLSDPVFSQTASDALIELLH